MPDIKCTWQDPPDKLCERLAAIDHTTQDGEVWARLCKEHDKELVDSQSDPINVPLMLRCWVRAGGGHQKMAARLR